MKKITTSIAILLLLAGTFFSCNNEKEEFFDEPIDVPFTVFSLTETFCRWVWRGGHSPYREVIIINSDEELQNFLICREESDFPFIDFSKYTLLLARGVENGISVTKPVIYTDLQQYSLRNYVMNVLLRIGGTANMSEWNFAIITDKLDSNARIRLNVTN